MNNALAMTLSIAAKLRLRKEVSGERVDMELVWGWSLWAELIYARDVPFRPILLSVVEFHQESGSLLGKAGFFAACSHQFLDTSRDYTTVRKDWHTPNSIQN